MNDKSWTKTLLLVFTVLCLTSVLSTYAQPNRFNPPFNIDPEDIPELREHFERYFIGKSITSILNTLLLLYLIYIYYGIYKTTKSQFSLGLIVMTIALLLFTISSSPLTNWIIGDKRLFGIFNFIPDIFTTIATIVLIYLSRQ